MNSLLAGGRDENVALLEEELIERLEVLASWEVLDAASLVLPVLELLRVHAIGIVDGAVVLLDTDALGSGSKIDKVFDEN